MGWLVVEDLAMVLVLVLLPPLAAAMGGQGGADGWTIARNVGTTLLQVGLFVVLMLVVGRRLFPWLLWQVQRVGSRELFTLCVVAAAVSIAYFATKVFGVSFALGAFFAGMVLRESQFSHRAAEETLPLRDAFAVLFFVSVGMLFNPMVLVEQPLQVLVVVGIIVFGKSVAAALLVLLLRYPLHTALTVSASLAQIGEFSFILIALGGSLNVMPPEAQSLVVAGALISIALNPLVFRGRKLAAALRADGMPFVVADQNREIVEKLRAEGVPAVFGDAAQPETLVQAHVAKARMLVIATPDALGVRQMAETAKLLNPGIEVVVRSHNEEEARRLEEEIAGRVFVGEHELALAMTRYVLARCKA